MLRILSFIAFCIGGPLAAQEGPSFDCAKAQNSAEELICADSVLSDLDRRLADRYAAAVSAAQTLDAGAQNALNTLRATQRGWIKGRNDCWKAGDLRTCVEAAYSRREATLVTTWMLEDPVAMDVWRCGKSPANEVVTLYFDTHLPSVRLERGDIIDSGFLEPTASGSKYVGDFGRFIWIKGAEATYREADPDGTTFTCSRAR